MIGSFVDAYLLKQGGEKFNHIMVLGILFAVAAMRQLQKAIEKNDDSEPSAGDS